MTVAALQNVAAEEVQADRALEIVVVFGFVGELVGLALDAAGLGSESIARGPSMFGPQRVHGAESSGGVKHRALFGTQRQHGPIGESGSAKG